MGLEPQNGKLLRSTAAVTASIIAIDLQYHSGIGPVAYIFNT